LWLFIFELPPAGMMSFTILITFSAQLVELGCAIQASMRTLVESVRHRQHRVFVRDYVGAYAELVAKISPQNFPLFVH